MKAKYIITGAILLIALTFGFLVWYQGGQLSPVASGLLEGYPKPEPPSWDGPFPFAEEVTLSESQDRMPFEISLPGYLKVQKVWASTAAVELENRSLAILFTNGVELFIHQAEHPIEYVPVVNQNPQLKLIAVKGHTGMGADPGTIIGGGEEYRYPGSVSWWENGLDIELYSDDLSLDELLRIADSIP